MKRILMALTICALLLCCNSCSPGDAPDGGAQKKTKLVVTSVYAESNSDMLTEGFIKAIHEAQTAFPQYEIVHNVVDTETYKNKIKIMMASNDLPDIFYTWTDGFMQPFVENGYVLPLNDFLGADASVQDDRFSSFVDNGSIYGMSIMYWYGVLYCNTEIFSRFSLQPPQTWDELISACAVLSQNGVEPIVCGLKDIWPGHLFVNQLLLQVVGAQRYNAAARGEATISRDELRVVGERLRELMQAGAFFNRSFSRSNDDATKTFLNGQAAMYFNGNNFSSDIAGSPMDGKSVAVALPLIKECRYPTDYLGKCSNGLSVSSDTANPAAAVEVARFIAEHSALASGSYTPWNQTEQIDGFSELEQMMVRILSNGTGWGNNYDVLLPSKVAQSYLNATLKLFTGESDGAAFALEAGGILDSIGAGGGAKP